MLFKDLHICRCKNFYCREHMLNHSCSFNYKQFFVEQNKDLVEIKSEKLEKI